MGFGPDNLPYASVVDAGGRRMAVVRVGDEVLDLSALDGSLFADGTLDAFLAAGPSVWDTVRTGVQDALRTGTAELTPLADVTPVLGFTVADYVDFNASAHHAATVNRLFRPDAPRLATNWTTMPVGYHGRAGTVAASGTPVVRPSGQLAATTFGPTRALDYEAELAFVIGAPSTGPVAVEDADRHVFGVCLLNDWSARDVQRFETAPLGPFLGKSFATSVSPWITPLAALAGHRFAHTQDPLPRTGLVDATGAHGLRIEVTVTVNGTVLCRSSSAHLHWTYAQLVAHLTSNGTALRTGDLLGTGTLSGPSAEAHGCLLELTADGTVSVPLDDGGTRTWLEDGDEVVLSGSAGTITLGDVRGHVVTARHSGPTSVYEQ